MNYWVAVVARNADQHIRQTIDSLLGQSSRPERIVVVDDGSTDATPQILTDYRTPHPLLRVLTLPDRGYDIRRVPVNLNLACRTVAMSGLKTDFYMVSGDDCIYPRSYTQDLMARMKQDEELVIASGRPSTSTTLTREHSPSGSGRMISTRFWQEVGGMYPPKAGWEAWLLYAAIMDGHKYQLFEDLSYEHVRARGSTHQFVYWGAAMETLGYHPLYALGRIVKNAVAPTISPRRALNMFRGYLLAKSHSDDAFVSPFDDSVRSFVKQRQTYRMVHVVASLASHS